MQWINQLQRVYREIRPEDFAEMAELVFATFQYALENDTVGRDSQRRLADGTVIYRKQLSVGTLPNATTTNTAHGISGFANLYTINVFANDGTDFISFNSGGSDPTVVVDATNIKITATSDLSGYSGIAVIEYMTS